MRIVKNIVSQMHRWVLWAILSAVFWGWIFTMVTDTTPDRKVTLFVKVDRCEDKALAVKLEESLPPGIRMIKVHPFSYVMLGSGELETADLYIVPASEASGMTDAFAPLDGETLETGDRELFRVDGVAYGVKVYDAASGTGAAAQYLGYEPGEDYYLFLNAASLHLGSGDGAALRVAEALLKLQ